MAARLLQSKTATESRRDLKRMKDINAMGYEEFIEHFANAIEGFTIGAAAVWRKKPFEDVKHIHAEICSFIDSLPQLGRKSDVNNSRRLSSLTPF